MKTVYAKRLNDIPYIPLLYPNLGTQERDSILFLNNAFAKLREPIVNLTEDPEEADAIVLAHNYPSLKKHYDFVHAQSQLAKKLKKPFIIFWHGDSDGPVPFQNATVIRTSIYGKTKLGHEIAMPAYAEDLLKGDVHIREKHAGKPVVGFCGWADYKNLKNRIGTAVKNSLIEAQGIVGLRNDARLKGITYRMKVLHHLSKSEWVQPNFIIRSSYSGHAATIKTDATTARREYVENLLGSDYALAIKGDGNYSYRFYEALSLGRIPVLLDTDCVLPLEDEIDYDSFVVRVPYYDLYHLDQIVSEHYSSVSEKQFAAMQQKARHAFEQYLRVDAFLQYAVDHFFG